MLPKLEPQLVPKPLWGISAAKKLGRRAWQQIRQGELNRAGRRCEICGEPQDALPGGTLICHEVWEYQDRSGTATLTRLQVHCAKCDLATHAGRAKAHGYYEAALEQLSRVNGISRREAGEVFARAMAVWKERNKLAWGIAVEKTLLAKYPSLAILETGKST
jgi:hypothetical protein